ncbi:MAG: hypothetical protein R6V29_12460, partial [Spirochaetia bacterium]
MQTRIIYVSVLVLLVVAASPLAAIDFGGTVGNTSEVFVPLEDGDVSYGQGNRVSMFISHAFSPALEFRARGRYEYRLDTVLDGDSDPEIDWFQGDLDAFYIDGRYAVEDTTRYFFDFRAGRFRLRDFSGVLLNERADGARISFETGPGDLTLAGGYTGLLLKESSNLLLSRADVGDSADDDVYFAPPRALGVFELSLPEIFGRQSINVTLIGQGDLRPESDLQDDQGHVHTVYYGGGLTGPLAPRLYYDVYGYFGGGTRIGDPSGLARQVPIRSYLAGANLEYFIPDFAQSAFSLGYLYSSGDADHENLYQSDGEGASEMFVGLTPPSFGTVFSPRLGNLMVTDFSYSIKPFTRDDRSAIQEFQTELAVLGFFRPTTGVISRPGARTSSDEL